MQYMALPALEMPEKAPGCAWMRLDAPLDALLDVPLDAPGCTL